MCQQYTLPNDDDLTQLAWLIAYHYGLACQKQSMVYQQYIQMAGPPGRIYHAVRRLPGPAPDVIQRTYVVNPSRDIVDLSIEANNTMVAPVYQDRTISAPCQPPVVRPRISYTSGGYNQGCSQVPLYSSSGYQHPLHGFQSLYLPQAYQGYGVNQGYGPNQGYGVNQGFGVNQGYGVNQSFGGSQVPFQSFQLAYQPYNTQMSPTPSYIGNMSLFPVPYGSQTFPNSRNHRSHHNFY